MARYANRTVMSGGLGREYQLTLRTFYSENVRRAEASFIQSRPPKAARAR